MLSVRKAFQIRKALPAYVRNSTRFHKTRCKAERGRENNKKPSNQQNQIVILGVDGVVCDLRKALSYIGWKTARKLWPDLILGSPSLYYPTITEMWPVVQQAEDPVLLIRIIINEVMIGKKAPKHRRIRPLRPKEVVENWDVVKWTCLRRWGWKGEQEQNAYAKYLSQIFLQELSQTIDASEETFWSLVPAPHNFMIDSIKNSKKQIHLISFIPPSNVQKILSSTLDDKYYKVIGNVDFKHCTSLWAEYPKASIVRAYLNQLGNFNFDRQQTKVESNQLLQQQNQNVNLDQLQYEKQQSFQNQQFQRKDVECESERKVIQWLAAWGYSPASEMGLVAAQQNIQILSEYDMIKILSDVNSTSAMDGISWQ